MSKSVSCVCMIMLALLMGCAKDKSFSPPVENEYVSLSIKLPEELNLTPVRVLYRSAICTESTYDGNFKRTEVEGYYMIHTQPQRKGQTDIYQAELGRDGGGQCKWRLSKVIFGVVYKNPESFGRGVTFGMGGEIEASFDEGQFQSIGSGVESEGNLILREHYYPWLDEDFLGRYSKTINLASLNSARFKYSALRVKSIYFEPLLHSNFILRSAGPKVKKPGNYTTYTYPDGSVYSDGKWHPDFRRLESIRLAAEKNK